MDLASVGVFAFEDGWRVFERDALSASYDDREAALKAANTLAAGARTRGLNVQLVVQDRPGGEVRTQELAALRLVG